MKYILFVDDDAYVLEGLQRMLFPFQSEWKMAFASSGQQALDIMEQQHFDVIVSDMRMPGMDGAELLSEVRKRHPETIRFVLTGQSDSETVYRSVGEAHQFLCKPCKPKVLRDCVDRSLALRHLLANEALKQLASQIGELPPMPKAYTQLCQALRSPESSLAEVGHIIEKDVAMTAKILQLVNSAFFGLRQHVSSAVQAASYLGVDTLKTLILTVGLFSHAEKLSFPSQFSLEAFQQHSLAVSKYTRLICESQDVSKDLANDAFTGGILHDTGMLVLAASCPEEYLSVYDYAYINGMQITDAEMEILGCTHAEIGAYLLGIWGLPDHIVEAVAYHHRPSSCLGEAFSCLTAVHAADVIALQLGANDNPYPVSELDAAYIQKLGLQNQFAFWQKACQEAYEEGRTS